MIELLLPYGFNTLEYSWVKATIGICTLADYSVVKKCQQCEPCVSLKGMLFPATKENIKLKQEVAYLTACLEKTKLSEKMIEDDLSRIEESATKSTNKLSVGFERCEDKGEKSAPKFIPSSNYHKEGKSVKPIKTHYSSDPKPSFNPKREAFVCMFVAMLVTWMSSASGGRELRRGILSMLETHRDEFIDFLPRSYSHVSPHSYSSALSCFSHGPNHRSYGFGS
jgi:hypothetical protein